MGVSTDAILVFGVHVGDEDEAPAFLNGYEDFEEFVDAQNGLPNWSEPGHDWKSVNVYVAIREIANG